MIEISCCEQWIPYPGPGSDTQCPACHTVFTVGETLTEAQWRNLIAGMLRACFAREYQHGLGSPQALEAWHAVSDAADSVRVRQA